jgi:hypothetical protein
MKQATTLTVAILITLTIFGLTGCGEDGNDSTTVNPSSSNPKLFVSTTDFATGSYSVIDLSDLSVSIDLPASGGIIESDHNVFADSGKIYLVNRFGFDNLTVLDPADVTVPESQFSGGDGADNAYAVALVSASKAYVCRYADNALWIVDPTDTGNEKQGEIDLSTFLDAGDADGSVEAAVMVIVGNRLFVALQRLVNWSADLDSIIAVIDTDTDTLVDVDPGTAEVDGIVLTGRNPQFMHYSSDLGKIVVSETGSYFANDGGVETVDPNTLEAEGFIIDEADIGGDIGDVAIVDDKGYVVYGGFGDNTVAIFDTTTGDKSGDLTISSPFIPSLAADDQGRLFVPDRTDTDPGVRVYDTTTDTEITANPINVGLPPNVLRVYE